MEYCEQLVDGVCDSFYNSIFKLCLKILVQASEYKQIICGLNPTCCT